MASHHAREHHHVVTGYFARRRLNPRARSRHHRRHGRLFGVPLDSHDGRRDGDGHPARPLQDQRVRGRCGLGLHKQDPLRRVQRCRTARGVLLDRAPHGPDCPLSRCGPRRDSVAGTSCETTTTRGIPPRGFVYDSGSLLESLDKVLEVGDFEDLLRRQADARSAGRLFGIGLAVFTEQTAHTTQEFKQRGVPIVFGYETARVRLDASGTAVVSASIHDHGQGLETTLAQIAADRLGLDLAQVRVEYGDTDQVAYGAGTFASRSAVLAGGAVTKAADAVAEVLREAAAHLLEAAPADITIAPGRMCVAGSPSRFVETSELCRIVYQRPEQLPVGVEPLLEASRTYDAHPGTGAYANAAHLASVEIDPLTGATKVLSYAVVEDCGPMINPLIVEGQVFGGVAQGIGTALFEEFLYDDTGQPLTTTFSDYLIPVMSDVPDFRIAHLETPSPHTIAGMKGMGESGAIAPGAVLAAAVEDAISPLGCVTVNRLPLTPERVLACIDEAIEKGPAA